MSHDNFQHPPPIKKNKNKNKNKIKLKKKKKPFDSLGGDSSKLIWRKGSIRLSWLLNSSILD